MYLLIFLCFIQQVIPKLLGVIELNRHGARTPKEFTSISSHLFFGSISSQLTFNGYNQHLLLGQWVAENYKEIIPAEFIQNNFLFYSSPIERTIFSAFAFIKGMYRDIEVIPRVTNSTIKIDDVPPIANFKLKRPMVTADLNIDLKDSLFHAGKCKIQNQDSLSPKIEEMLLKQIVFSINSTDIHSTNDELKQKIEGLADGETDIYSYKFLERVTGLYFPVYYHYNNLYNLSAESIAIIRKTQINRAYTKRLLDCPAKKLITSNFYDLVKKSLERFILGGSYKFLLLTGHDTNQADVLSTLMDPDYLKSRMKTDDSNYYFVIPKFASSIIIEFHMNEDFLAKSRYYLKFIYNGEEIKGTFKKPIRYDSSVGGVTYDSFVRFLEENIDPSYKNLVCTYVGEEFSSSEAEQLTKSYLLRN
jgi:hypothetical protein